MSATRPSPATPLQPGRSGFLPSMRIGLAASTRNVERAREAVPGLIQTVSTACSGPLPRLAEQIFARAAFAWTDRKRAVQSRKGALRVRRTHHSLASSGARTDEATDRPAGIGWPPPSAGGPAAGVASRPRSARSSVRSAPHSFPDGNLRSAADHPVVACRSSRKLSRQEHCRGSGAPQCQSGIRQSVGPRREVYASSFVHGSISAVALFIRSRSVSGDAPPQMTRRPWRPLVEHRWYRPH
ncbi:hypothetical protein ACVWWP_003419 [Bradyrhizobium sp. LM3.6]